MTVTVKRRPVEPRDSTVHSHRGRLAGQQQQVTSVAGRHQAQEGLEARGVGAGPLLCKESQFFSESVKIGHRGIGEWGLGIAKGASRVFVTE